MNKLYATGRLINEPVYRKAAGVDVCDFTLSVNTRGKNDKGYPNSVLIKCTVWRRLAELAKQFGLYKGKRIAVCGMIDLEQYTAKDSTLRTQLKCDVDDIDFMLEGAPMKSGTPVAKPTEEVVPQIMVVDEEVPF